MVVPVCGSASAPPPLLLHAVCCWQLPRALNALRSMLAGAARSRLRSRASGVRRVWCAPLLVLLVLLMNQGLSDLRATEQQQASRARARAEGEATRG
jgi:hypothetical protein